MPTYQYACTEDECGHAFEQFQNFTEDSLTVCPECDGRLRKVFNAVGVVFKGSGFYRTDSRSGPDTAASPGTPGKGTDSNASAGSGGGTAASAPATPATTGTSSGPSTSTATAGAGAA